jgi:hypothetical protein
MITILEKAEKKVDDHRKQIAGKVPSARTVSRIMKEFDPSPEEEKAQYRHFYWPESMERGDLPWEASAAGLEILASLGHARWASVGRGLPESARPSIRLVKWLWRITLVAPGSGFTERYRCAVLFSDWEGEGDRPLSDVRALELQFARGW